MFINSNFEDFFEIILQICACARITHNILWVRHKSLFGLSNAVIHSSLQMPAKQCSIRQ